MPTAKPVKIEIPQIKDCRAAFSAMNSALIKERHRLEEKYRIKRGSKIVFKLEELTATHAVYSHRIERVEKD